MHNSELQIIMCNISGCGRRWQNKGGFKKIYPNFPFKASGGGCLGVKDIDKLLNPSISFFEILPKSGNDLQTILKKLGINIGDGEIEEMIKVADKNGEGLVNIDEFLIMMDQ